MTETTYTRGIDRDPPRPASINYQKPPPLAPVDLRYRAPSAARGPPTTGWQAPPRERGWPGTDDFLYARPTQDSSLPVPAGRGFRDRERSPERQRRYGEFDTNYVPRQAARPSTPPRRRPPVLGDDDTYSDDSDLDYEDVDHEKGSESRQNITINLNIGEGERGVIGRPDIYRRQDGSRTARTGRPARGSSGRIDDIEVVFPRSRSRSYANHRPQHPSGVPPVIVNNRNFELEEMEARITDRLFQKISADGTYFGPKPVPPPLRAYPGPPPPPPRRANDFDGADSHRDNGYFDSQDTLVDHSISAMPPPSRRRVGILERDIYGGSGNALANDFGPEPPAPQYPGRPRGKGYYPGWEVTEERARERERERPLRQPAPDEAPYKWDLRRSTTRDRGYQPDPYPASYAVRPADKANVPMGLEPYLHRGEKAWTFSKTDELELTTDVPLEIDGKPVVVPLPSIDQHLVMKEADPQPGSIDPCKGITEDVASKIFKYFPFAEGFCAFIDGTLQLVAPDLSLENVSKLPRKFMGMRLSISQCVPIPSSGTMDGMPDLERAERSSPDSQSNTEGEGGEASTDPTSLNSESKFELTNDEQERQNTTGASPQFIGVGRSGPLVLYGDGATSAPPMPQRPKRMNEHGRVTFRGDIPGETAIGVVSTAGLLMTNPRGETRLVASCHAAHESLRGSRLPSFGALHRFCPHRKGKKNIDIIGAKAYDAENKTLIGTISQTYDPHPIPRNPPFPSSFPTDVCLITPSPFIPAAYLSNLTQKKLTWYEHSLSTLSNIPTNSRVRIFGDDRIAMTVGTFVQRRSSKPGPPRDVNPRIETVGGATATLTKALWDCSILYRRLNSPSSIEPLSGAPVVAEDRNGDWTCLVGFQSLQFIQRNRAVEDNLDKPELKRRLARGECSLWGARFPPRELVEGEWKLSTKDF